jgi:pimeloyl-ACP methyl ester carboxylesterase
VEAATPPACGVTPIPPHIIEDDCGHFPWLERPGAVRRALDGILS